MDTRVLEYFLAVAKEENMTKAAQLLHVTQPTVSRQLMKLEEDLGVRLLNRNKHNVQLTNEGQLFRRRAQEIIDTQEMARAEITESRSELIGEIIIGCWEMRSIKELSDLIYSFHQLHPKVRFKMMTGNAGYMLDRLEQGTVDFVLLPECIPLGSLEFIQMRQEEEWGILTREDSPLAGRDHVTVHELAGTPVVTTGNKLIRHVFEELSGISADKIASVNVGTYNTMYSAAMLVRSGMGNVICLHLDSSFEGLDFIPFEPAITMSSVLAWKNHGTLSGITEAFCSYIREQISEA